MNNDDLMRAELTALRAVVTGLLRQMRKNAPDTLSAVLGYAAEEAVRLTGGNAAEEAAAINEIGRLLGSDE